MRIACLALLFWWATVACAADAGDPPSPEALAFIRRAKETYVFPYKTNGHHRWSESDLTRLGPAARVQISSLLGQRQNWYSGLSTIGEFPNVPSIGILFRSGAATLELYLNQIAIDCVFHGVETSVLLEDSAQQRIENWKKEFVSTR